MNESNGRGEAALEALVGAVADEFTARLQRGETPSVEEYAARHPEIAAVLRQVLPALEALGEGAEESPSPGPEGDGDLPLSGTLGDFRIIREVGRGGMGIVYEAEQMSLRRRVALKVLPNAGLLDPRQLQRFQNEAQTAACLHHTNIVPVYAVGCERGVHFYAMQFLDGQTLAALLGQLRQPADPQADPAAPPADTEPLTRQLTQSAAGSKRGREYYRRVAELGVQAAEALDHAHQMGIVHRDVKPGNLMLDGSGRLWVTDFGLAHIQHGEGSLTMTGDLVGTLRYMSPEQALAKRAPIDNRTDVYSLGVTLYELLTLRPACDGKDRQELLRQIAFDEPARPRRLDRTIPAELEVIVLKAMEKNPADRYATAQDLADDLRRWLEDRPIRARRPSWRQVAAKWARRHRTVVRAAAVVVLVVAVVAGLDLLWWAQRRAAAAQDAERSLRDTEPWQAEGKWPEALALLRPATTLAETGAISADLGQRVRWRRVDLETAARLDDIRTRRTVTLDQPAARPEAARSYAQAFQGYGIDVTTLEQREAAEFIRSSSIPTELASALDDWAYVRRLAADRSEPGWQELLAVARAADPDPERNRVRDAYEHLGQQELKVAKDLAASVRLADLRPGTLLLLEEVLGREGLEEEMTALLRKAQREHPGNFYVTYELATWLWTRRPPRRDEAIRFSTAALGLRPRSAFLQLHLGNQWTDKGALEEAVAAYEVAIQLRPDFGEAYTNLGGILAKQGDWDGAIQAFQTAVGLKPEEIPPYLNLALALENKGEYGRALDVLRRAEKLKPGSADLKAKVRECERLSELEHNLEATLHGQSTRAMRLADAVNMALVCVQKRLTRSAARQYRQLFTAFPALAEARNGLRYRAARAAALAGTGQGEDAGKLSEAQRAEGRRLALDWLRAELDACAKQLEKEPASAWEPVQQTLPYWQRHRDLASVRDAAALANLPEEEREAWRKFWADVGDLLARARAGEAAAPIPQGVPERAREDFNLGVALRSQGKADEAETHFRKAIALKGDYARAHCELGRCLRDKGKFVAALEELRLGHELGVKQPGWDYPSAQWVKECERLVELDAKLPRVLKGEVQPADGGEWLALAEFCDQRKALYVAAVRCYTGAFAAEPKWNDELPSDPRYTAACCAALAASGQGKDAAELTEKDRARLREQALGWLRADLAAWNNLLVNKGDGVRTDITKKLSWWMKDADFARVRERDALAKLPEAERLAWQKLWADVGATLARAKEPLVPKKMERVK
jgi:serine/threonine protein kinase/Tfp pilus assembly protein PilF